MPLSTCAYGTASVPAAADAVPGDVAREPLGVDLREEPLDLLAPALRARRRRLRRRREELLEPLPTGLAPVFVDRHDERFYFAALARRASCARPRPGRRAVRRRPRGRARVPPHGAAGAAGARGG